MRNIDTKIDNTAPSSTGRLSAAQFNSFMDELENIVTTSGQALDSPAGPDTSLYMLAMAVARYASGGVFGTDTGAANAHVVGVTSPFRAPAGLFKGMQIHFFAKVNNSGATTLNAFSLGVKKLLDHVGGELTGGEILASRPVVAYYEPTADNGTGAWMLAPWANARLILPAEIDPGYGDPGTPPTSFSSNNKIIFNHTGADQTWVIPPDTLWLKFICWGGSGGGIGGYATAIFAASGVFAPGQTITVVVGGPGADPAAGEAIVAAYGFGAVGENSGNIMSGGLSGVFTGSTPVAATDQSRARIIAGGGGGTSGAGGGGAQSGGSGGDTVNAGGNVGTMRGLDATGSDGCGGGGYEGGHINAGGWGEGGTSYVHVDDYSNTKSFTARVNTFSGGTYPADYQPPNASDPDWGNAGLQRILQSGPDNWAFPGRVVIYWST